MAKLTRRPLFQRHETSQAAREYCVTKFVQRLLTPDWHNRPPTLSTIADNKFELYLCLPQSFSQRWCSQLRQQLLLKPHFPHHTLKETKPRINAQEQFAKLAVMGHRLPVEGTYAGRRHGRFSAFGNIGYNSELRKKYGFFVV